MENNKKEEKEQGIQNNLFGMIGGIGSNLGQSKKKEEEKEKSPLKTEENNSEMKIS